MKFVLNNLSLSLLPILFVTATCLAQNPNPRDFNTDHLFENDLYINHLTFLIDNGKASVSSKGPKSTSGNLRDLLRTAKNRSKQLRNNKNYIPVNIPVPFPPCSYKDVCGSDRIKGMVVENSVSDIQAYIVDMNNNIVANLASDPMARNETHGLKVHKFNWHLPYKGEVKIVVTRTGPGHEKQTYEHQAVIQ